MTKRVSAFAERTALSLLLAAFTAGVVGNGAVSPFEFTILAGLVAAACLAWVTLMLMDRDYDVQWPWPAWTALMFAAYAWWRTAHAPLSYPATLELARVALYAIVFVVAINLFNRPGPGRILVYFLAVLGAAVAAYALYQFAVKSDRVLWLLRPDSYAGRGSGTFICPNSFAGYLAITIPLVTSLVLGGRTPVLIRIVLAYTLLVMLAGLTVSLSRGGWIATSCGLGTLILLHFICRQHTRRAMALLIALSFVAAGVATRSLMVHDRLRETVEHIHVGSSVDLRLSVWRSAWRMWLDHPWLGVGPGHFDYRYPAYRETSVQARPVHAHNDYLNTLADWGVVGTMMIALTVTLTLATAYHGLRKTRQRQPDLAPAQASDRWSLLAGSVASISSVLCHSLVDFDMQLPGIAVLVIALMALICGLSSLGSKPRQSGVRAPSRWVLASGLLCATAWLAACALGSSREAAYLREAAEQRHENASRRAALTAALRLRPDNFTARYALGESHRLMAWAGMEGYEVHATNALAAFELARGTNPFDPYNPARIGMCLDWLGRHTEAAPHYEEATRLDPNNYHLSILRGWHHLQTGELIEARRWFSRSLQQKHWPNAEAARFLAKTDRLIIENRTSEIPSHSGPPR